jgi:uncharacterized protein (TIGR00369 family)
MTDDDSPNRNVPEDQYDENTGFSPTGTNALEQLREHAREHPLIAAMNITFETFDNGTLRASIPHNDHWANPGMGGTLHGGMVVAYLDTVMGFAIMASVADESLTSGPTVNLNTNFLSPANEDLIATGEIVRIGSSSAVVDGTLENADTGEPVATAQGVWRVYTED